MRAAQRAARGRDLDRHRGQSLRISPLLRLSGAHREFAMGSGK
jgi:hypothetical protein